MASATDDPHDSLPFAVTANVAVFTIRNGTLRLALVRRGAEPFQGLRALPGGFVRMDEDLDQAAVRKLRQATSLRRRGSWHVEQLGSYGTPGRDPRMRVVTVAYVAVCRDLPSPNGAGDAVRAELVPVEDVVREPLAFDHGRIVKDALERIRSKIEYTTLAAGFLQPKFSVSELRGIYETVWDTRLDEGNFQRWFRGSACFERVGLAERRARGRPASLWSARRVEKRKVVLLDRPLARRSR